MRRLLLATLCVSCLFPGVAVPKPPHSDVPIPSTWLVLPALDLRGRRPFAPSAVFRTHLLDPHAAPPQAGQTLVGETGTKGTWRAVPLDDQGTLAPDAGGPRAAWAYAAVTSLRAGVFLARLRGAARMYVNGDPFVGDVYRHGRPGVPVALRAGVNHVYVTGLRGRVELTFVKPPAPQFVPERGTLVPDLPRDGGLYAWVGAQVVNASTKPATLRVRCHDDGLRQSVPSDPLHLCPLGMSQAALRIELARPDAPRPDAPLTLTTVIEDTRGTRAAGTVRLRPRDAREAIVHTFRSRMDDSVQHYALRPPTDPDVRHPGFVVSLHGAGVSVRAQATSYSPKPDFWLVVPTNRGPFGFDWQDWGRQDVYEVLSAITKHTTVDLDRIYLTGHSMGGHGTWHLAANDPDRFAAIAPSAGWVSFDTYGGARPQGALRDLWHAADGGSRTLRLVDNLVPLPTYVLHGDADKNVPAREARTMLKALREAGGTPQHHFEPGKGHWWDVSRLPGVDCVDWPAIFEMFRTSKRTSPARFTWTSVDAATDSSHHWISLWQPIRYGEPMRVEASYRAADKSVRLRTTNVHQMFLHHPETLSHLSLDGAVMSSPPTGRAGYTRKHGHWSAGASTPEHPVWKHPRRQGPLRQGMRKRFLFVYGTAGHRDEREALLARARFDAQSWTYRAQGNGVVVTDEEFLRGARTRYADRDVVLYGNQDTNRAWRWLVPSHCPLKVRRGRMDFDGRTWRGNHYAAAFVYPRQDSDTAHVVGLVDTGTVGTRVGLTLPLFRSGVGFPDYVIYGRDVLEHGDGGVEAAGWFDGLWRVQPGGHVRGK